MSIHGLFRSHDSLGLADLVRRREVGAAELLEAAIERAEALNPRFNFIAQRHYDYGRRKIAEGLPEGPFTGVPWLLKDLNTYIAGELTEGGSRFYKGCRATVTSELVHRIERAGFVIFGKTTTPEFGLTATTENLLTGQTRNPWNPAHIAGGSSGGGAAAVAAGVIPAAHATDGGGSIRIPAACCGLFGLKPSRGRVPMGPLRTEGWGGMSTHHAVTWSVRDSAAILDATHGIEPGSRYTAPEPDSGSFLAGLEAAPKGLRVALMLRPFSGAPVDPEVAEAARAAARLCETLGHHVEEAAPEVDQEAIAAHSFALMASSIAADVEDRAKATGIEIGPDVLEEVTLATVGYGRTRTGMDFARGNNAYQAAAVAIARFMADHDVILSPTTTQPARLIGELALSGLDFSTWGQRAGAFAAFTGIYNGTGQPSMSVPLAMSANGLPIGVMFTGRYGEEALLLRLARQLEQAAPWSGRRPAV